MKATAERRRSRRAELDVTVEIRPAGAGQEPSAFPPLTGEVKNISLAGVYAHVKAPCPLQPGQHIICSIHVPPEQARWFPFARILGKGWVIRLDPVQVGRRAGEAMPEDQLLGLAIAFAPDVTALATLEL